MSTETVGLLGTGAQDGHLDFHTAPELCVLDWLKCCFTSTETVGLLGTGAQDGHLDFYTSPELCLLDMFLLCSYLHLKPSARLGCMYSAAS